MNWKKKYYDLFAKYNDLLARSADTNLGECDILQAFGESWCKISHLEKEKERNVIYHKVYHYGGESELI